MSSTEDADTLVPSAAAPELTTPDDTEILLDALPISELASMWGTLQRLTRCDQTSAAWAALMYFNRLSKRRPDRALDLALEILRAGFDKLTAMQFNDKFMRALIHTHGAAMIDRIEREAAVNERFRDLLGGVRTSDELKARLDALVAAESLVRSC